MILGKSELIANISGIEEEITAQPRPRHQRLGRGIDPAPPSPSQLPFQALECCEEVRHEEETLVPGFVLGLDKSTPPPPATL